MASDRRAEALRAEIKTLQAELDQLEAALPPHSVKPHHLQRIEELEDRIEQLEKELEALL